MGRDAGHMDLPTPQMQEKQDIIRHQPAQRPHLGGEEVRRNQDIEMRADELFPRGGRLPLWRRWDTVALEDIAHGLITDYQAEIGQGANDPVIAPRAILLGDADNQRFQLRVNSGTAWRLPLLGAIELLGDQCAMPGENRLELDDLGHCLEGPLAELLPDHSEGLALTIAQPDAPLKLVA